MIVTLWVIVGSFLAQEEVLKEGTEVTPSVASPALRSQRPGDQCLRLGDAEAFGSFWKEHGGKDERPSVDFSKEMVLIVPFRQKCCSGSHPRGRRIYVRETSEALRLVVGYQSPVSQPPVPPGHVHQDSTFVALAAVPRSTKSVEFYLRHEIEVRDGEATKAEPPKLLARIR